MVKSVKKKNGVAGWFAIKYKPKKCCRTKKYCRTTKLNRVDYGVDKYWVLLAVVKEKTPLKHNNTVALT